MYVGWTRPFGIRNKVPAVCWTFVEFSSKVKVQVWRLPRCLCIICRCFCCLSSKQMATTKQCKVPSLLQVSLPHPVALSAVEIKVSQCWTLSALLEDSPVFSIVTSSEIELTLLSLVQLILTKKFESSVQPVTTRPHGYKHTCTTHATIFINLQLLFIFEWKEGWTEGRIGHDKTHFAFCFFRA